MYSHAGINPEKYSMRFDEFHEHNSYSVRLAANEWIMACLAKWLVDSISCTAGHTMIAADEAPGLNA